MESIRKLDRGGYDAIVMAQVSMRALLPELGDVKTPMLCSFYSGYGAIADRYKCKARTKTQHLEITSLAMDSARRAENSHPAVAAQTNR